MDDDTLRHAFRRLNRYMLLFWRLGLGPAMNRGPAVAGRYLVLVHRGRRTRQRHHTPLNYGVVGGEVYCVAGFGTGSDWYRNVVADPEVEVWLPDGRWQGLATDVTLTGPETGTRTEVLRAVLRGSGFAALLAGLDVDRLSDADLLTKTDGNRLIHLARQAVATGPDGPDDLVWVWPFVAVATVALAAPWLGRRRRGRRRAV